MNHVLVMLVPVPIDHQTHQRQPVGGLAKDALVPARH
jgi:hypothetical protein